MRYEDVGTEEAIDLILSLPQGSRYVAATDPMRAWSDERHGVADVVDAITVVAWALRVYDPSVTEPPRVTRPRDVLMRALARERVERTRNAIEQGGWEEM